MISVSLFFPLSSTHHQPKPRTTTHHYMPTTWKKYWFFFLHCQFSHTHKERKSRDKIQRPSISNPYPPLPLAMKKKKKKKPKRTGSQPTSATLFDTRLSTSAPANSRSSLSSYSPRCSSSRYLTASSWRDWLMLLWASAICTNSTVTTDRNPQRLVFGPCIGDGPKVW